MESLELEVLVPAPVDRVWAVYVDHLGWQKWAGIKEVVLRQTGDPPPNGLGAMRVMRRGGIAVEEEITAFEPHSRLAYRHVGGLPVREYEGEVCFSESEGATRVRWVVRFRPLVPGTGRWLRAALERQLRGILERLASLDFAA